MRIRLAFTFLICGALLLAASMPVGAVAASPRMDMSEADIEHANDTTEGAKATPTARISQRRLLRALPTARSFGPGTTRQNQRGNKVTVCGGERSGGPNPIRGAGAIYRGRGFASFMAIEAHRNARKARQRFQVIRRETISRCDGIVDGNIRLEVKRARPIARLGQQNWVRGYAARDLSTGEIVGESLQHVYRIGRFVIVAEVIGGNSVNPTVDRRPLQRPFRQLGNGVRRL